MKIGDKVRFVRDVFDPYCPEFETESVSIWVKAGTLGVVINVHDEHGNVVSAQDGDQSETDDIDRSLAIVRTSVLKRGSRMLYDARVVVYQNDIEIEASECRWSGTNVIGLES